jgi:hypothetical protein
VRLRGRSERRVLLVDECPNSGHDLAPVEGVRVAADFTGSETVPVLFEEVDGID